MTHVHPWAHHGTYVLQSKSADPFSRLSGPDPPLGGWLGAWGPRQHQRCADQGAPEGLAAAERVLQARGGLQGQGVGEALRRGLRARPRAPLAITEEPAQGLSARV